MTTFSMMGLRLNIGKPLRFLSDLKNPLASASELKNLELLIWLQ